MSESTVQPASPETTEKLQALIEPDAKLETIATEIEFSEGPCWIPGRDGKPGFLLFSDIPGDIIYKWSEDGGKSVWREPSHLSNGNTLDEEGNLISCEHGARSVSRTVLPNGQREVIFHQVDGKTHNSPNDVVVKSDGSVWFTDPTYGLLDRKQEFDTNVWCAKDQQSEPEIVQGEDFDMPNGLCFSPDESLLYIADSGKFNRIMVYEVDGHRLKNGRVFTEMNKRCADGMRVDTQGNLWTSAKEGVQIFSPDGTQLGTIFCEKQPTNLCFGGEDGTTLFITARPVVYKIETKAQDAAYARRARK